MKTLQGALNSLTFKMSSRIRWTCLLTRCVCCVPMTTRRSGSWFVIRWVVLIKFMSLNVFPPKEQECQPIKTLQDRSETSGIILLYCTYIYSMYFYFICTLPQHIYCTLLQYIYILEYINCCIPQSRLNNQPGHRDSRLSVWATMW